MQQYVCDVVSECVDTGQVVAVGIKPATFGLPVQCSTNWINYEVKSVRVGDISELSLVPSISVCLFDSHALRSNKLARRERHKNIYLRLTDQSA